MGCCSVKQSVRQPNSGGNLQKPTISDPNKTIMRKLGEPQKQMNNGGLNIKEKDRVDTPLITENDGRTGQQSPNKGDKQGTGQKPETGQKAKQRVNQYFDISPKTIKKNKVYHISSTFPISRPYSNLSDWQKLVSKSQQMPEEELIMKLLQQRNRNWIQEQIKLQLEINYQAAASFDSLVTNRKALQLKEHFSWFVWAMAQFYFQQKTIENKFNLPKQNTRKWSDGFEYKGVYIKVLPYEDSHHIRNEIQAIKYLQMELLELNALAQTIMQQYGQIKENLHKDVMLPLITGISCGGFYLYGTPVIYTQDLDNNKSFFKDQNMLNASKVAGLQNSSVVYNQNQNSIQMQALINQSNMSYSYLHNNISPDFVQESLFKFMPIMKNVSTMNMIPIIDFEEYNDKHDDLKETVELKYFLVSLSDIIPRLSEKSASTLLMRLPTSQNEEISFHSFPRNSCIELRDIRKLIDDQEDKDIQDDYFEFDHKYEASQAFTKKFFMKHGWDFILMQKQNASSENKRATNLYLQRETVNRGQAQEQKMNPGPTTNQNMLFIDDYQPKDEGQIDQLLQQQYQSPHKQSILKRSDSQVEQEAKICGNVLISAYNYRKDFRLQYSMSNHTYSTNIESLFSASIDQVAQVIEQSDNVYNHQSIKELFHRKGLNMRFQWVVLPKLRSNQQRELVMIDILVRVMRRIINEEMKLKSVVPATQDNNQEVYYQGNQLDQYKEAVIFYMNSLLKKKVQKNKNVFEETLLGLFLSRMSILGIIYSLNLKKEEFFYFESKDLLEDIIDAPSKNPVFFLNTVQSYFKLEFQFEINRICRQDKHLFLSKGQPLQKTDIKTLQLKLDQPFSIREYTFFMLARQITSQLNKNSPPKKINSKIKTKTDKDKLKQSFARPKEENPGKHFIQMSARGAVPSSGIGPGAVNDSMRSDASKTNRQRPQGVGQDQKESMNTIRQYQNMDRAIVNESLEFTSPPLNNSKLTKLASKPQPLDFSKLSKRTTFKPSTFSEIILPSILYKLKTYLSSNPMYYFDEASKTYIGDTMSVLRAYYEMPNLDIIDEWVIIIESLLKDVYSVYGTEQVLLEALVYQATQIYFFKSDLDELFKVLAKIRDLLFLTAYCSPETLLVIQVLTGLFFEEQKEQAPMEAEKAYLTGMICIQMMYGDPRGRGNITIPYSLYLSWKLSLLSLAEDKKIHDSEFAEEIFDAALSCLPNHKKCYREQQRINSQQSKQQNNELQTEVKLTKFELEVEKQELSRLMFDIKKYKHKPFNQTFASNLPKSGTTYKKKPQGQGLQQAGQIYVSVGHNFNSVQSAKPTDLKSKSQIPMLKQKSSNKNDYDLDPSDIDLEVEDEQKHFFIEENFKNNEWYVGVCPFQHWSLYRQQIQQIMQAHNNVMNKNNQAQAQYQKQVYKEMLQKSLPKDLFYQWLIKFNPVMYQCGMQWSNQQIKELIFCQNQQMVSSSGSSVVMSSSHNLSSKHSLSSSIPTSAKEKRNMHLGSYSQILSKDAGGLAKQDLSGTLFSMGTDANGQLGLDIMSGIGQSANVKVMYPRMIIGLRDEIIKEVCCGHSHTLVLNINGNVFGWGNNQNSQLGLGPEAPALLRKPILSPYLQNITKLSAGNEHSLAISKSGELFIWGGAGLTGLGHMEQVAVPQKIDQFSKNKVLQAVCGGLHTVVITKEGETYSWGSTEGGQLGLPQQQIVALCQSTEMPVLTPQRIPKLEGIQMMQVACGEAHCIAMAKDGTLYGWGMSNYGQLGLGFSSDTFEPGIGMEKSKVYEPQEIKGLKDERISKLICGATFSLFHSDTGALFGCGMNDLGQLGLDTFMEEMQIATLEKAKRGRHQQSSDVTLPTRVICFQGIALHTIACGENHALAVSGDDKNMLWAWGMYKNGQLGLGEVTMKMNPRPVQTLCSSSIQRIACGSMHSVALIGDTNQVSTHSSQFYANNENVNNQWHCDLKGLCVKDNLYIDDMQEDEVPDDGEGHVKNPF